MVIHTKREMVPEQAVVLQLRVIDVIKGVVRQQVLLLALQPGKQVVQDLLMKRLKVPSLMIEGDIVDLNLFDPADALRKAETFEETMDHYKKVRKEEGFAW